MPSNVISLIFQHSYFSRRRREHYPYLHLPGDGLTFDEALLTSQITAAFDAGTTPDGDDIFPDPDGDTSASEIVTQPPQEGDVLVVQRGGGGTHLVSIYTITFVDGSNDDSYTVLIKY